MRNLRISGGLSSHVIRNVEAYDVKYDKKNGTTQLKIKNYNGSNLEEKIITYGYDVVISEELYDLISDSYDIEPNWPQ